MDAQAEILAIAVAAVGGAVIGVLLGLTPALIAVGVMLGLLVIAAAIRRNK